MSRIRREGTMTNSIAAAAAVLALALTSTTAVRAAEVSALISNAFKSAFEEIAPQFEKGSEHKLKATFGTTDPLKVRIEKGEAVDFTILGEGAVDELVKQGKLVAATRVKDGPGAELVGKGETEIGLTQASEVLLAPGVELAGTLPAEIQNHTVFAGAVAAAAREPDAAKALFKFLASPEAIRALKAKGLEPAG
jgi:ABC-type molybdate transport system substrate-binding protein